MLGAVFMERLTVVHDRANNRLGFTQADCTGYTQRFNTATHTYNITDNCVLYLKPRVHKSGTICQGTDQIVISPVWLQQRDLFSTRPPFTAGFRILPIFRQFCIIGTFDG